MLTLSLILALTAFITLFNPQNTPIYALIIPVLLGLVIIYRLYLALLNFLSEGAGRRAKAKREAIIISFAITSMIVINSVNQLTLKEVGLGLLLTLLMLIYSSKL